MLFAQSPPGPSSPSQGGCSCSPACLPWVSLTGRAALHPVLLEETGRLKLLLGSHRPWLAELWAALFLPPGSEVWELVV